jgi:hypothetical protein
MISSSTDAREIRKFGAIVFIFFGILFGIGLWRHKVIFAHLFGVVSFLGLCFLFLPAPLRKVYTGWLKFADFLGRVTTIFILSLAYYFIITPTALVKRLLGGRPLPISPDKTMPSYWVTRPEPAQPKERFAKRY